MTHMSESLASDRGPRPWPEDWAGLVNGGLILCVPMAVFVAWLFSPAPGNMAIGRDPLVSDLERALRPLVTFIYVLMFFVPVALIVGWRTWAHAKRVLARQSRGWQGVLEAGAVGLGLAWWVLLRPTLMNPAEAPPYLIAYGIIGVAVGLGVGLILRVAALFTLWIESRG